MKKNTTKRKVALFVALVGVIGSFASIYSIFPEFNRQEGILEVELDKPYYMDGDNQNITIKVPRKGHLYVASLWANGEIYVLFPYETPEENFVKAGQIISLPEYGWEIKVNFPENIPTKKSRGRIITILSKEKLSIRTAKECPTNQSTVFRELGFLDHNKKLERGSISVESSKRNSRNTDVVIKYYDIYSELSDSN